MLKKLRLAIDMIARNLSKGDKIAFTLAFLLSGALLFAQTPAPSNPMPDIHKAGIDTIAALTPILGLFAAWALKAAWNKIPASLVLFVAPILSMAINYGASYLPGHMPADLLAAAALGMIATWIREFGSTLASKGFSGAITPTALKF